MSRLADVLKSWEGTPYREGQCVRRQGVNCVFFVAGVLDDLYGMEHRFSVPRLPVQTALHDHKKAFTVVRALRIGWHGADRIRDGSLEPGDVIVTRATNGRGPRVPRNPGHAMIVDVDPGYAWEASRNLGVHRIDLSHVRPAISVYRPRRKDLWAQPKQS